MEILITLMLGYLLVTVIGAVHHFLTGKPIALPRPRPRDPAPSMSPEVRTFTTLAAFTSCPACGLFAAHFFVGDMGRRASNPHRLEQWRACVDPGCEWKWTELSPYPAPPLTSREAVVIRDTWTRERRAQ